jgi:hypothetical protein
MMVRDDNDAHISNIEPCLDDAASYTVTSVDNVSLTISRLENCARWALGGGPATVPRVIRRVPALDGAVFVCATVSAKATRDMIKPGIRKDQIFRIAFPSCVHDVGPGLVYQNANIKVMAIENTHFAFHKGPAAGKHKSYSYRFDTPGRIIVFTSDTGFFDGLVEFASGADLLVAEANSIEQRMQDLFRSGQWQVMTAEEQARIKRQMAEGHLSTEDVGKLAAEAGVKSVVLSHLTRKSTMITRPGQMR